MSDPLDPDRERTSMSTPAPPCQVHSASPSTGDEAASRETSPHASWAEEGLNVTEQCVWRWRLPEGWCRFTRPSAHNATLRDEQVTSWRALLRAMSPAARQQWVSAWRNVACGNSDRLDITLQPAALTSEHWWRVRGRITLRDADGRPAAALGVWESVPPPGRDAASRVRAHAFVASRDPMLVVDDQWRILEINDAFRELGGAGSNRFLGQRLQRYVEAEALRQAPSAIAGNHRAVHHEGVFHGGDSLHVPIELTLSDFTLDGDHGDVHYIAALRDISARKRSERELEHLASIDTLTQLPNRATLQYSLNRQLPHVTPHNATAVLFIDLDGFKHINDSLGHQAGDSVLRIMVKRLRATLRSKDLVARWGGDEFVVVLAVGSDGQLAVKVAHRLLETLAQPMVIGGHQISITASIGIVHAPADGVDSDTLLKHADVAMYAAKDQGKNAVVSYHDKLKHHNLEQMSMLSQLREAIAGETLNFVVQPKFDSASRVIGAELLARWSTTDYGQVPPSTFVPLAEHNGMASALGNLAIEHAARYAARLAASGHTLPVAVNISALHVMDESLAETLRAACRRHHINTDQIELEVTESVFLENTRAPEARIEHLRQQGFRVAMDDFGSGYSSLGYLKRLPFDTIKIDRSFMNDLEADLRSRHLLAGIVGLCNLLGMETVAEGVETLEQWKLLQELGIQQYQGYYLGRPMEMDQLLTRLAG